VYQEQRTFTCELKPASRNADLNALEVTGFVADRA
jgi:hypothetical protein